MKISQLIIYPIKGLGGIELASANALERGFENDRRFMLVDPNGRFLSQRVNPQMALFGCSIDGNKLKVNYKDESINLNIDQQEGAVLNTTVWKHSVDAIEVGKDAHEWFSDMLGLDCKLVKMNKETKRKKSLTKAPRTTQLSFADGYPYLALGTASLAELNEKLETPVTMDRFRANIIIDTEVGHQEEEVDKFTLSDVKFRMIKPCARCQVITIDQKNASTSKEPLKTLATYRKKANKIYFGMNAVCLEEGIVNVGDELIRI